MRIEFADKRIQEYVNGQVHFKNDGSEINVSAANAEVFLNAKHWLDGEWQPVFIPVVGQTKKEQKEAGPELLATYPEGFPASEHLVAAGLSHSDAILLTREQLTELKGIGAKSADAILAFVEEK
jgi:ERCC4-type nuclease